MIKVLDHGSVQLIETWGSDERIIEAARMSTDKGFRGWGPLRCGFCLGDGWYEIARDQVTLRKPCEHCGGKGTKAGDEKLLRYLWEHKHHTPFEMAGATFEIQAPIFVFREWQRHRTQCIASGTPLVFERPADSKAYPKTIESVVRSWNDPSQRSRLSRMGLRGAGEIVHITDAWHSGIKRTFRIETEHAGSVEVSEDHVLKTPEGPRRLCDGVTYINGMVQVGQNIGSAEWPIFSTDDLRTEEWRYFLNENYEVSNLGRVRSWITTRLQRRKEAALKTQTINRAGRAVVSAHGRVYQVSHMVAACFIGGIRQGEQVLHINDNPLDNRVLNLYVGTPQDNVNDQYVNGGRKKLREVPLKITSVVEVGDQDTFDISVTGEHWFVAGNLLVHNSYNELSARYTPIPDVNYAPSVERLLTKSGTNKQAQGTGATLTEVGAKVFLDELQLSYLVAEATYQQALDSGVPKELARLVIPVGRYSRMRASANLRNWLSFLTLRNDPAAQWEIQAYAQVVQDELQQSFPRTLALFKEGQA